MSTSDIPVLIIGAGVAGLCASLFLSEHAIPSILIERHKGTSVHPRARSVNSRTMELFRHLGLAEAVRDAGKEISASKGILSGSSLREVIEKRKRVESKKDFPLMSLMDTVSCERGTFVTQDCLEPILLEECKRKGYVDLRFYHEYVSMVQDEDGVKATIRIRETGDEYRLRAQYLLATDGAKSPIRNQLGIEMLGPGTLGHLLNVLFRADLGDVVRDREFSIMKVERPEVLGFFGSINNSDRWTFHISYDPSKGERPQDYPPARCVELLRLALGYPNLDINIISIMPWEPSVRVIKKMQRGRVFLMGDAAHQMPPYGGQGANSAITDAYNLAWKLAFVLKGTSGPKLLETFETERFPVGLKAAMTSAIGVNDKGLIDINLRSPTVIGGLLKRLPLMSGHGYVYTNDAIYAEDTSPLGGITWRPWTFASLALAIDGRPGQRVPHVWLNRMGEKISTIDLCGNGFVLLAGEDGKLWVEKAKELAKHLKLDLEAYVVGEHADLMAKRGEFEATVGITSNGAILVRPDDHVTWRQRRTPKDYGTELEAAIRKALCI